MQIMGKTYYIKAKMKTRLVKFYKRNENGDFGTLHNTNRGTRKDNSGATGTARGRSIRFSIQRRRSDAFI